MAKKRPRRAAESAQSQGSLPRSFAWRSTLDSRVLGESTTVHTPPPSPFELFDNYSHDNECSGPWREPPPARVSSSEIIDRRREVAPAPWPRTVHFGQ